MNKEEDMGNIFRSFQISKELYSQWSQYATKRHVTMKNALAELLHNCPPGVYYTQDQDQVFNTNSMIEFNMRYTKILHKEIFNIFMQTGYKNQSIEMNREIILRLKYALK